MVGAIRRLRSLGGATGADSEGSESERMEKGVWMSCWGTLGSSGELVAKRWS